jgi:adenine-specific DNA methylase
MPRYVHPFPARMAPEVALAKLKSLKPSQVVLDPMAGSGTVIRSASELGLQAIGCDLDPLAILMTKVSTRALDPYRLVDTGNLVSHAARARHLRDVRLPWMDECEQTTQFVAYWFARPQRNDLRRISAILLESRPSPLTDALWLCLSRIIITKTRGASLAWDVSHSRPHRVKDENDFDVLTGFSESCAELADLLLRRPALSVQPHVHKDDARILRHVASKSVDSIITSPPYLNAIDYFRGHRLALVWFGLNLSSIRAMRSSAIGSEVGITAGDASDKAVKCAVRGFGPINRLPAKYQRIAQRYGRDLILTLRSCARVLRRDGQCHFVVADSRIQGIRISNSGAVIAAAKTAGFEITERQLRRIPRDARYLPAGRHHDNDLAKRMLTEHVLSFRRS